VDACKKAAAAAKTAQGAADAAAQYVRNAAEIEWGHVSLLRAAEEEGLPAAARVANRAYASYTLALNDRFFAAMAASGTPEVPGMPPVTEHLWQTVWTAKGRRAVVVVDALRYDCAMAVRDALRGCKVDVEPVRAMLPTVTSIGMTALLPIGSRSVTASVAGNAIHPRLDNSDTSVRDNRLAVMKAFGADCRDIAEIEAVSNPDPALAEILVVVDHDEVDSLGHGEADNIVRHVQLEIDRLARLVRKLHRWGYPTVHIVTDHGFILLDESRLPDEIRCDKDWCLLLKERFALVPRNADLPLVRFPFAWNEAMAVAVPPGLAFFKAEKSFSHGGAALQEMVIPHLTSHGEAVQEKRIEVEVLIPAAELQRTAVKVVLRPASKPPSKGGQMALFAERGRTLSVDVVAREPDGAARSVLAGRQPKELRLEADGGEQSLTLFFHSAERFTKGEVLELDVRDDETSEQFPPGGIKLTIVRDM